jgi:hypothetical protein
MLLVVMRHQSLMPNPFVIELLSIPKWVPSSLDGFKASFSWQGAISLILHLICFNMYLGGHLPSWVSIILRSVG